MMNYSEKTLQYYNNLKNVGEVDENLKNVGTGIVGSPLCGDVMKLQLVFGENDIIQDVKYKIFGCVSAFASMELASSILKGKTIEEARKIKNSDLADTLELSDIKRHCSVLAKEAIEAAVNNYLMKKEGGIEKMITVSEEALKKLKELVSIQGDDCLGVGIVVGSGGCSGVEYLLKYENNIDDGKKSYKIDDLTFFYKEDDEPLIRGVNIDIMYNSIGHGFIITNKTQFSCKNCTCGCGNR